MAAWAKEEIPIPLFSETTGLLETTAHTVEVYPTTDTYPTNKVACTQASGEYTYFPDSDLDDETSYWVRVDGTDKYKLFAKQGEVVIGF
jgi:hypothetical protein